jgi:hypothetical protein
MGLGARLARCGVYQNGHGGYRYLYLYLVSRVQLAGVRARAPLSDFCSQRMSSYDSSFLANSSISMELWRRNRPLSSLSDLLRSRETEDA